MHGFEGAPVCMEWPAGHGAQKQKQNKDEFDASKYWLCNGLVVNTSHPLPMSMSTTMLSAIRR